MNTFRHASAIALLVGLGTGSAFAFQGEMSPLPTPRFESTRDRATVRMEARDPLVVRNGGTGVMRGGMDADRAAVRARAVAATRDGSANFGEIAGVR